MLKIKKNDNVIVISGKDKGKTGKVIKVLPNKNRVIVEKINIVKKHVRPNPQKGVQGGTLDKEAPINISNVMYLCSNCGVGVRVGFKHLDDGSKVRYCKKCGTTLD